MSLVESEENIKVVVRVRPTNDEEKNRGETSCVRCSSSEEDEHDEVLVRVGPHDAQVYNCTRCFHPKVSQKHFFHECGLTGLLDSAIGGYRACAFAFGQTGAGKTYTIVGPGSTPTLGHDDDGILGNSLQYLFRKLDSLSVPFTLRLSCMEIYKEQVFDLLATGADRKKPLNVREHAQDGFFLDGCTMLPCQNLATASHALGLAMQYRRIGGHDMNSRSNRSHCLTDVFIELPGQAALQNDEHVEDKDLYSFPGLEGLQKEMESDREYTVMGRITLIDLAGSENMKRTNSSGKQAIQEAGFINKSLYVLGQVIQGLAKTSGDPSRLTEVPFRDSKLTKLLISSLGGQSRTLLLACIAESSGSITETLRTLKFSMSCARIKNKPVRFLDPQKRLIMDLRSEIRKLRSENELLRKGIATQPEDARASRKRSEQEEDDVIMPMRRVASAAPSLQPLKKGSKNSQQSLSTGNLRKPGDASTASKGGTAATRGRESSRRNVSNHRSSSMSRSRSRSTARSKSRAKSLKKAGTPSEEDTELQSVRSSRSARSRKRGLSKSKVSLARNLGLPEKQLEHLGFKVRILSRCEGPRKHRMWMMHMKMPITTMTIRQLRGSAYWRSVCGE
eukprot:GSChrysophyteH1.ASY1.ANO1.1460.1 assembled CDS